MGTKANPATFDCYANAEPDEPMFILLARDVTAPGLVRAWVTRRIARGKNHPNDAQIVEALECAKAMEAWVEKHELMTKGMKEWRKKSVAVASGKAETAASTLAGDSHSKTPSPAPPIRQMPTGRRGGIVTTNPRPKPKDRS